MKKRLLSGALLLTTIALLGCSNNGANTKNIYSINQLGGVGAIGSANVIFKEKSEIPYISLQDGVDLMTIVRSANLDDKKYAYKLEKINNEYVISNETGAKCSLNITKQTMTYDDYDRFTSVVSEAQSPLSMVTIKKQTKAYKVVENKYQKGNQVVVDLNKYSILDITEKDNKCYLPLSVYNSLLLNVNENVNLAYNTKDLFLIPANSLSTTANGIYIQTELGAKFREGVAKETLSKEYIDYNYQSLCLDFDYEYGLKNKFNSFDEFVSNFKDDLLSSDVKKIDNGEFLALTYLNDGHTVLSEVSNFYEPSANALDRTRANPAKREYGQQEEAFEKKKKESGISSGLEYRGNTVFVTFDEFTNINNDLLYHNSSDKTDLDDDFTGIDEIPGLDFGTPYNDISNTAVLFNTLYKELKSEEHINSIKNIVIDLSSNGGGAADGLIYALATLIGDVTLDLKNPLSGGSNHQTYKADINADGEIDNRDVPLIDLGFKIYFLNSKYTFSSANAMAVIAKINKPSVVTMGDKTGGGPCSVRYVIMPNGSAITASSLNTISKYENNNLVDIDSGVNADIKLTEDEMLNRQNIVNTYLGEAK